MDVVTLLKMLFHCFCIFRGVGAQEPIFVAEKLFRYFLAMTVEPELYVVHTVPVFFRVSSVNRGVLNLEEFRTQPKFV